MVKHDELIQLYNEAETHQKPLFAEQRSNLLLVAGNHYNRKDSKFWRRIREAEKLSKSQKLRLTKNHTQKITKGYTNNLLAFAPGVMLGPKNEGELADQKAADLHNSVWKDIKQRHKWKKQRRQFAQDFVEIGEAICKIFFDYDKGTFLGYEQEVDEDGFPLFDEETGEEIYSDIPLHTGDLVYERILGFNLLTDPEARSWEEIRWACYRKMIPIKDLEAMVGDDEQKLALIAKGNDETYKVFDTNTGSYGVSKHLVMLLEFYFRPCAEYPNGYYQICTKYGGTLFEGELPLGIFPIIYAGFDEASTSARSYSIIKQLRPYQAEINRAASKIAEHHISLGDDKVLLLNGSKMEQGGEAYGVKSLEVTGTEPKIMAGRDGSQYAGYMGGQISEMYLVANMREDSEEQNNNLDPYNMLFLTAAQKKKFKLYTEKFQEFEEEVCLTSLRFAKEFYHDEMIIPVIGKKELVNLDEFRSADDLGYEIIAEAQSEDLESRMGKQLSLNHLIQYAGAKMESKDLGRVIRSMEYINKEQLFDDETLDYDNATSDILAMDRGELVPPDPDENHAYVIKRLINRKKQKDFRTLDPQIQLNYQQKIDAHRMIQAQQIAAAQAAKDGFIPTGGFLANTDLYMPDPKDPTKRTRVKLPSEAIWDLTKKLEAQGSSQQMLEEADLQTQAKVGQMIAQQQQQASAQPMLPSGAVVNI